MGRVFWIRRFFLVAGIAFVIIAGAQWLQGGTLAHSASQALIWALISASIFTGSRIYQSRKGRYCALCQDLPASSTSASGEG